MMTEIDTVVPAKFIEPTTFHKPSAHHPMSDKDFTNKLLRGSLMSGLKEALGRMLAKQEQDIQMLRGDAK